MKRLLGIFLVSVWTPFVCAAPIDLWQAWEFAQNSDPQYAAQQAQTQASQEQIIQARAQLLPSFDAVASLQRSDTRRASQLDQSHSSHYNQWQLRLSQPLLNLAALAQFERSKYLAASSVLEQENAKNDLVLRLSRAYFDVLAAEDTLSSLHAQHKAVEHQLQAAQYAFELGGATITDTYEAQSRLDLVNAQLIQAQQDLAAKHQSLSRITGQPISQLSPLHPEAQLPAPDPLHSDAWVTQASLNNLDVAKQNLAVQAQQYQLKASEREHSPTISLQARSGSQSNMGIHGMNQGPRALDSSIGIELEIPLYQGGAISSRVRENASVLQQQMYEQENARRAATEAAQLHFNGVVAGIRQVQALAAAERSSRQSVAANETAYEIGVRVNMDVLDAQQQLYETQRALAHARYNTLLHGLSLKNAAGQLQEIDLIQLNQLLENTAL